MPKLVQGSQVDQNCLQEKDGNQFNVWNPVVSTPQLRWWMKPQNRLHENILISRNFFNVISM
jgi:hypothetical protein